jgi:hypothetical protein
MIVSGSATQSHRHSLEENVTFNPEAESRRTKKAANPLIGRFSFFENYIGEKNTTIERSSLLFLFAKLS